MVAQEREPHGQGHIEVQRLRLQAQHDGVIPSAAFDTAARRLAYKKGSDHEEVATTDAPT